jgi:AbrB family looped-hinge helix DNA binding protein
MAVTTTVDRFGRVVIPKETRDRFGLGPGAELTVADADDGILLRPGATAPLVRKGGVLVFTGKARADARGAVARVREERVRRFWPRRAR